MKKRFLNLTRIASLLLICLTMVSFTKPDKKTPNGAAVIKNMHSRWHKKWYPNFAFEQRAIFYEADTVTREEVWQEIYSQPGNLSIRFNGFESGNGVIFNNDSLYTFKEHKLMGKVEQVHPLVLLGFDVYFLQPELTASKLEKLGFDLSKTTEAKWQGRDAYVVGTTNPEDNTTPQFWVDKERLYVVRILTNPKGTPRDVEFANYQQIDKNWVATEIIFKTDGKLTLREEYFNMSFPKETNPAWFMPSNFANAKW